MGRGTRVAYFVPKTHIDKAVEAIERRYIDTHSKLEVAINSPVAYIMKYIFKTLDDLRENQDLDNLSDLSIWYLKNKIQRFTMSQTFISLDVYRSLKGKYDLYTLTKYYNRGRIQVLLDPQTNKILQIHDEFGNLYSVQTFSKSISYQVFNKPIIRKKQFMPKFISIYHDDNFLGYKRGKTIHKQIKQNINKFTDMQLYEYFKSLDIETVNLHHYAYVNNQLAKRDFYGFKKIPLDSINTDFNMKEF